MFAKNGAKAVLVDVDIEKMENAFGSVDILINNASVWKGRSSVLDTSVEEWRKYFDINVFGTVNFIKAVLPKMIENGYGKIVNVSLPHYSVTKAAVIAMTKAVA